MTVAMMDLRACLTIAVYRTLVLKCVSTQQIQDLLTRHTLGVGRTVNVVNAMPMVTYIILRYSIYYIAIADKSPSRLLLL